MEGQFIEEESGKEISLQSLFDTAKRNTLLIVIVTLVLTILGGIYGRVFVKTKYTASAEVIVIVNIDDSGTITPSVEGNAYSYSVNLTSTIADSIVKSDAVMENTSKNLEEKGVVVSTLGLKNGLKASVSGTKGVVIDFSYTSQNEKADVILDCLIENLIEELDRKDDDGNYVYGYFSNKVKRMSSPNGVSSDANSKVFKYLLIAFALGLVLSCGIVVNKVMLDDTYREKDLFERENDVEVLATLMIIDESKGAKRYE